MADPVYDITGRGWTRAETSRRQREVGLRMTPAERLAWLEDILDELLPLVGRARHAERRPSVVPGETI